MKVWYALYSVFFNKTTLLISLSVSCSGFARSAPPTYYEGQIEPHPRENFSFAQYCCWLPPIPHGVKGVLCVVLHPHGITGVEFENPQPWIALATRYRCALLSLSFVDATDKNKCWSNVSDGSGRSLIAAIDEVANVSGVVELAQCKIVVAGICEAGQFAYGFSAYSPERTAAFMTMGGSMHEIQLAGQAASVPGLLVAAVDRGEIGFDNMFALFTEGQKHSAPWSFALESIEDYDEGRSSKLVKNFLEKALDRLQCAPEAICPAGLDGICIELKSAISPKPQRMKWSLETTTESFYSGLDGWLPDQKVADLRNGSNMDVLPSNLSFVSVPLPATGYAEPQRINAGTLYLATAASEQIEEVFHVHCAQVRAVDDIAVVTDEKNIAWQAEHTGAGEWRLDCKLDLSTLPCGAFTVQIPIRFSLMHRAKPGGMTALVSGRILRDVSPQPAAINFGGAAAAGGRRHLTLKSVSGTRIEMLSIESSAPNSVKAEVVATGDAFLKVDCWIDPSGVLPRVFNGYFLLRVRSDRDQTIKILFYGENIEGKG